MVPSTRFSIRRIYSLILLALSLSLTSHGAVMAADAEDDAPGLTLEEDAFKVGGSCAALAYLSQEQLRKYTSSTFASEFSAYCYPEEPFDCSDYTSFLKGTGQLSAGSDGYYCQLH